MRHAFRQADSDVICENTDLRDTYLLLVNKYFMPPDEARAAMNKCMDIGAQNAFLRSLEFPGADSCTGNGRPVYADHPQLIESKT